MYIIILEKFSVEYFSYYNSMLLQLDVILYI